MKQIYPASITGKGHAAGGSVLDHSFGKGDLYTLGVEEEFMLLDPETFDLVQHVDTVLGAMAGHEFEAHVNPELMQSVIEVATPGVPQSGRRRNAAAQAARVRHRSRAAGRPARRARRARIPSVSSSGSGSPRATATATSSTSCSTSRAAS